MGIVNKKIKSSEYEKLFSLFLLSVLIALYWTFNDPSTYSSEQSCYSTAHSFFTKYQYLLDNRSSSLLFPEVLNVLDSFTYSRIVIELFSKFSDSLCYSSLFLRFNCHLLPLLGASLIYNNVLEYKSKKIFLIFSFISLSALNIFLKIPFPPANFNYPFLAPYVNYNSHLNGNLTTSFCLFLFSALFIIQKSSIRKIVLFIGGIFNPIITSLFSLFNIFTEKNIKNKNKKKLLNLVFNFFIPYLSYFSTKFIWNFFSGINRIKNISAISQEKLDPSSYLKFVDLVDFHRNRYSDIFYDITKIFLKLINFDMTKIDSLFNNQSSIYISYSGYILFCILCLLLINSKYITWSKSVNNILKKYIRMVNPLFYSLLIMLPLDFFIKLFSNSPQINIYNLLVLYNQLYISRFITLLFTVLFFISIIFIFFMLFEVARSINRNYSIL